MVKKHAVDTIRAMASRFLQPLPNSKNVVLVGQDLTG